MKKIIATAAILGFLSPLFAGAATFMHADSVSVKDLPEIRDNLYVAGKIVSLQQVIFGDALLAGETVSVSENISDDLWVAGNSVTILGNIGSDARVAGSNLFINGNVSKDLIVAGSNISTSPKTTIGGDTIIFGNSINLYGTFNKSVHATGDKIFINGIINGNVNLNSSGDIVFAPGTKISGDLTYRAPKELPIDKSLVNGKIVYEKFPKEEAQEDTMKWIPAFLAGFAGVSFLILIIAALLVFHFAREFTASVVESALSAKGREFVRGVALAVIIPTAGLILMFSILGLLLGGLVLTLFVTILIISKIMSGIVFGSYLAGLIRRDNNLHLSWKTIVGGSLAMLLLCLIPVVGIVVNCVVFFITFGAVSLMLSKKVIG